MSIPQFNQHGWLPDGIYDCTVEEAGARFGAFQSTDQRPRLWAKFIEFVREAKASRLVELVLLDGSFVTAKSEPKDVDAVMLVPADFAEQAKSGMEPAMELEEMFAIRQPDELFMAEDEKDWNAWCDFLAWTREPDGRRKGIVEVKL